MTYVRTQIIKIMRKRETYNAYNKTIWFQTLEIFRQSLFRCIYCMRKCNIYIKIARVKYLNRKNQFDNKYKFVCC